MIEVNGFLIQDDIQDIVTELRTQLHLNGVERFKDIKKSGNNLLCNCPFHNSGLEKRPSFGILLSDRRGKKAGTGHCFRGDTKVITKYGTFEIKDLCNTEVEILNGKGEWENVVFRNYGKQQLWDVRLVSDKKEKHIFATSKHRWIVHNKNRVCGWQEETTDTLKVGQFLERVSPLKLENIILDPVGVIHGYVYGDGSLSWENKAKSIYTHNVLFYTEQKAELLPIFEKYGEIYKSYGGNGVLYTGAKIRGCENYKQVPDIKNHSVEYLLGFLAGYFVADGNCTDHIVSIYSHNLADLQLVRDIATRCGVVTTHIGTSNIKAGRRGCLIVKEDIKGYTLRFAKNTLPDSFFITSKKPTLLKTAYIRNRYRIVSVSATTLIEDVYCCQTSTTTFALEDFILVGNCFTCGWAGSLEEMISNCFGKDDFGVYGSKWLVQNFLSVAVESRPEINLDINRDKISKIEHFVSNNELDSYRQYHSYMWVRKLTPEIVDLFDIGYDPKTECITFPQHDENGNVLFIARRSVKTKFFNYPESASKPLYGLYQLKSLEKMPDKLYICESMLDALSFWRVGKPAVALNGLGNDLQFKQLRALPIRTFIAATDCDKAGLKARERIASQLKSKITLQVYFPEGCKDANDCTDEQLLSLDEHYL